MGQNRGVDPATVEEDLRRIEREVEAGNADLRALGFWRVVGRIKRDPELSRRWAGTVGRIDAAAFERRVRPRFPVWLGNGVLVVGTAVLVAAVPVAVALARRSPGSVVAGLLGVVAAGGLSVTLHDLGHWGAGRLAGIRFTAYFLDGPFRIQPGLKTDYETYLLASPGARAWMHAAGALASKVAPFAVFVAVYLPHRGAGYALFPSWSLWVILGFGVVQIATDLVWSTKASDWKKFRRERSVARAVEG